MPNKSYKLHTGEIHMVFEFYNKVYTKVVKIGSKVLIVYYVAETDTVEQVYGKIRSISLSNASGNDKLHFQINNLDIVFSSVVSMDVIEGAADNNDIVDIPPLSPNTPDILALQDLILSDVFDLYEASNAEDAFREIGRKLRDFDSGNITEEELLDIQSKLQLLTKIGEGDKFLSDDGMYKSIDIPEQLTEIDDTDSDATDSTFSASKIISTIREATGDKVIKVAGKDLSSNDYTDDEKDKLTNIDDNANNYVHPSSHDPSIILETILKQFVSSTEKADWTAKASKAYVDTAISNLIGASPELLNTLNEFAIALGNDPNFATTIMALIGGKVDKITGKGLSTNDYSDDEKAKVLALDTSGDGGSYLSNDGTYKPVSGGGGGVEIDDLNLSSIDTTLSSSQILVQISAKIAEFVGASPDLLNTLDEVTNALNDDPNFSVTIMNLLSNKVDKIVGKGLSTNDYSDEEKAKTSVIDNTGDGTQYLSNDGTYKPVSSGGIDIDDVNLSSITTTLSAYKIIEQIATKIAELVGASPDLLNTLDEITNALNDDPNFSTTIMNLLSNKVDKVAGKGLSTNDYSDGDKAKTAVINTAGDGSQYLSDDGTYKSVPDAGVEIDDINLSSTTTTLSSSKISAQIATKIAELVGASPDLLNTLDEITNALNDDPNFSVTITNLLSNKVDKVAGKGLSTNDYNATDKTKVGLINNTGDGTKYLSDDGTYKTVSGGNVTVCTTQEITTLINTIFA